jgi:ribonucleoside-diphosphate reductase alpha chain
VRFAKSIVDYIFRWMATKFLSPEAQFRAGVNMKEPVAEAPAPKVEAKSDTAAPKSDVGSGRAIGASVPPVGAGLETRPELKASSFAGASMRNQEDAPPCTTCGSIMIRSGSCYKCANCGTTSGCA